MVAFSFMPDLSGTHFMAPSVNGGGDTADGGLVVVLNSLLEGAMRLNEAGTAFDLFPGIRTLAENVHPLVVHFPIALLSGFFLLELTGTVLRRENLRRAASWMLYLGVGGAFAAVAAGLIAEESVPHGETVHGIMETHKQLGLTVAGLSLVLMIWRLVTKMRFSVMAHALHFGLAALMIGSVVFAADLGGLMVYQYGVGVKSLQAADDYHHHHHGEDAQMADEHHHDADPAAAEASPPSNDSQVVPNLKHSHDPDSAPVKASVTEAEGYAPQANEPPHSHSSKHPHTHNHNHSHNSH